jgi:NADH dehydrogenase FAD-containing subunit
MSTNPPRKQLVLLGAGRAHLQVLKGFSGQKTGDLEITLVAPTPYYIEPSMLAGYVAGTYQLEDLRTPLDGLVEASGVNFVPAHVQAFDPASKRIQLSSGDALPYDVVSIDVEPEVDRERIDATVPGARRNALFTRPLESFVQLWPQVQALARQGPLQVAVVTDSLAGVELTMAVAHALAQPHGSRVTLIIGKRPLLAHQPSALRQRVLACLKRLHVTLVQEDCTAVEQNCVQLANGASLACDAPVFVIDNDTPAWLLQSGLQTHESGELAINKRLQSDSHRQVFVVPGNAPLEVGPVLEANLRTALDGGSFKKAPLHSPRLRAVGCGGQHAIAVWGPLSLEGREVWHWKDRRDRRQLINLLRL